MWHRGCALLNCADRTLLRDGNFMLRAITLDPGAIRFAAEELRKDCAFGLAAIAIDVQTALSVDVTLWRDLSFLQRVFWETPNVIRPFINHIVDQEHRHFGMLLAIRCNAAVFLKLPLEDRRDRDFVRDAANQNIAILCDIGDELRGDREFILDRVQWNGLALQFANGVLRGDWEIATLAVVHNAEAMQFVAEPLKSNKNFATSVLTFTEKATAKMQIWRHLPPHLGADEEIFQGVWGSDYPLECGATASI